MCSHGRLRIVLTIPPAEADCPRVATRGNFYLFYNGSRAATRRGKVQLVLVAFLVILNVEAEHVIGPWAFERNFLRERFSILKPGDLDLSP